MSGEWHVDGWFEEAERAAAFAQRVAWMKAERARETRDAGDRWAYIDQHVAADFAEAARRLYGIARPLVNIARDF